MFEDRALWDLGKGDEDLEGLIPSGCASARQERCGEVEGRSGSQHLPWVPPGERSGAGTRQTPWRRLVCYLSAAPIILFAQMRRHTAEITPYARLYYSSTSFLRPCVYALASFPRISSQLLLRELPGAC